MVPTPSSGSRRIVRLDEGGGTLTFDLNKKSGPECHTKELTLSESQAASIRSIQWIKMTEIESPPEPDQLEKSAEELLAEAEAAKPKKKKSKKGDGDQ